MLALDKGTLERLVADTPDWVASLRDEGFRQFEAMEMPSQVEEVWRYVDLDLDLGDFAVAEKPGAALTRDEAFSAGLGDLAGRALVVDGVPIEVVSDAPAGVTFAAISTVLDDPQLRSIYGTGVPAGLDKFAAAHHAFGGDGVFLFVPKGTAVAQPFLIDVQSTTAESVSFPRITLLVEDGADANVVIHYRSGDETLLVVPQIESKAGANARLRVTGVQEWGSRTTAIAQVALAAERDATVTLGEVGVGGALARLHITIDLNGQGSRGEVDGLYFGDRDQVLDYRAFMNHRAPNTTSDMFLKGAVEDDADSVFTGLIRIEPQAQKTNAFQTNRNLVLSEGAEAQSVPNLEILANDVKCGHGSTVGPLDLEQRYYLMSRGLDRIRADRLQVRGFFEEAIRRLPVQGIADSVRERVNAKYVAAQEEGRV
ncbi:MAG: Fe-S cluster assembly protein SufD [Acidimicrobiia bacterium]|nr:Fe-S cluster assembly protein SufD [Acidimicrobiia bacterium]MDH3469743.1 Fe-S cluster assembly protein SufD [Acidimicrobiia bacterium]